MADFKSKNGQTISIPDNLTLEQREVIAGPLKRIHGIDINETNIAGRAKAFGQGLGGAAASAIPNALQGLVGLVDRGNDSELYKSLGEVSDSARSIVGDIDPAYQDLYSTKAGQAFGSVAMPLGAGLVGRSLFKKGIIKSQNVATFGVPAPFVMGQGTRESQDNIERATELGENVGPVQEIIAEIMGAGIGLSEMLPIAAIFKRIPKTALKNPTTRELVTTRLKSMLKAGAGEGLQEVSAGLAQDLVARGIYSDQLPIGESLFDDFTLGGLVGGTIDLAINSMAGRRNVGRHYQQEKEARLLRDKSEILEKRKQELAIEQQNLVEVQDLEPATIPDIAIPDELGIEPNLTYAKNPDDTFSILDLNATDNSIIDTVNKETDAINTIELAKNKFEIQKIDLELKNNLYMQGLINNASAFELGTLMISPNSSAVNLKTVVNLDSTIKDKNLDEFREKISKGKNPNTYRGVELKEEYTIPEVKKILNKKDFNTWASQQANEVFLKAEEEGYSSITAGKETPNLSAAAFKDVAKSKNILLNFNDKSVKNAAEKLTGTANFKSMSQGQKELFMARLYSLPRFNHKTKLPDFSPRNYNAAMMKDFVANMSLNKTEFNQNDLISTSEDVSVNQPFKNKEDSAQFIDDLLFSGRAIQVEGTNKYKIKENFEFDLLRKSEGFNETPDEFRERLIKQKLPENLINDLVAQEEIKQAKVLPPKEIEEVQINYADAVEQGKLNKFAREIKNKLRKLGLSEVGAVVSNDILSTTTLRQTKDNTMLYDPREVRKFNVEGEYDRYTDTIFLSLNSVNPDGNLSDLQISEKLDAIFNHELIHVFRKKDLITEKEYQYLRSLVKRKKVPKSFDEKYAGKTFYERAIDINQSTLAGKNIEPEFAEEFFVEEAVAELFRARNFPDNATPSKVKGIYNKIVKFFRGLGSAMRLSGFSNVKDIYNDIESGKVGSRERGEIRTLRELDKLNENLPFDLQMPVSSPYELEQRKIIIDTDNQLITDRNIDSIKNPQAQKPKNPGNLRGSYLGLYDGEQRTEQQLAQERETIIEGMGTKNLLGIMSWMSKNAPTKDFKIIGNKVRLQLQKLKNAGYSFAVHRVTKQKDEFYITGFRSSTMGYVLPDLKNKSFTYVINDMPGSRPVTGTNKSGNNGVNYETMLHESLHASTLATIEAVRQSPAGTFSQKTMAAYNDLDILRVELILELQKRALEYKRNPNQEENTLVKMLASGNETYVIDYILGRGKNGKPPGMHELITFGLTNRQFQALLESIPYKGYKKRSFWNKFVESIRELLGIPAQQDTALSALLEGSQELLSLTQEQINETTVDGIRAFNLETIKRYESKAMPTFSRGRNIDRDVIEEEIKNLDTQIYNANNVYNQDFDLMQDRTKEIYKQKIQNLEQRRNELVKDLKDLPPTPPPEPRQPPLFSRGQRQSQRKWDEQYYHVAKKQDADRILKEGFSIDDSEFFYNPDTEIESGGLVVFTNPVDAIAYHRSVDWKVELSDLVLIAVKKNTNRDIGNVNWQPNPNSLGFTGQIRQLDGEKTEGLLGDEKNTSLYLDINNDNDLDYFKNVNNILGSATLEELTQTKINPYFGKRLDNGNMPTRFYSPDMSDFGAPLAPEVVKGMMTGEGLSMQAQGNETRGLASTKKELGTIITKYMNDIANILNPPPNTQENIKTAKALKEVQEISANTPRGAIPYYNTNASDIALEAALEFTQDESAKAPKDIPNFSRGTIPDELQDAFKRIGGPVKNKLSQGARFIEAVKDPITSIRNFFKNFRTQLIDKLDKAEQRILQGIQDNEQVRLDNNTADTSTMGALRMADRARGLFQKMLTRGFITDAIEGENALAKSMPLEISTKHYKAFEGDIAEGGLIQILSALNQEPNLDGESIFKLLASLKRISEFNKNGKIIETPVTSKDLELINKIENDYPQIAEAYENYQKWNNKLIEFATAKGLLSAAQAKVWIEHSSYYPFYKEMVEEGSGLAGPRIAGGSLPNNPLAIKLKGSEDPYDVDPIEAISRNSLAILTASLKNDGVTKLLRDLTELGQARPLQVGEKLDGLHTIFAFENGNKTYYETDIEMVEAVKGIGAIPTDIVSKILAVPAGLLRDTVTRDPGFVVVNLLRDTMSAAVTSGADFTPIIDTFANMAKDMEQIEQFGVIGGYDFANDEGSVKQFIDRTMRQQGLKPNNSMSAQDAFFKVWDGLGSLTTKSDGATRLAVYDAVYKRLKAENYTEAQAQSEAAFQALEVINFGRRGMSPLFRVVTAGIPFLNARIQGLDVLYRSATGRYSAVNKLQENQNIDDVKRQITTGFLVRGGTLMGITLMYYLMVHDDEEYKNLKREVRDDNWVIPIPGKYHIKIPIPFEVGMLFKTIPERFFDMTLGDDAFTKKSAEDAYSSITRQLQTTTTIPFFQPAFGFQFAKPLAEAFYNNNTFTGTDIVPYYQLKQEPGLQSRATTNEFAKRLGEFLNISPMKIEHVMRGYTGTLGSYVLSVADTTTRAVTGENLLPSNFALNRIPLFNRLLVNTEKAGGYQQQFYELRGEVERVVATINKLKQQERFDELSAYRSNMQGVLDVEGQVRSIERYLNNWRKRRDSLMRDKNVSVSIKSDLLRELELERDKRLAFVPELRKEANIPFITMNL